MKVVLALFLCIAASSAYVIDDVFLVGNSLDDLVTEALEYVRTLLKKHDPYTLPPMPDQRLVDTDVDFTIATNDVKVTNGGDFTIDKISNNLPQLKASFGLIVPTAHIEGNYKLTGTAFKKSVQGSGTFVLDVSNLVQTGDIQFDVDSAKHSLVLANINLDYSIGNLETHVEGLTVEGMSSAQLQDLLNRQFMAYLNANKPMVTEKVGAHVKEIANKLINGKSLNEIIAWLKRLIASTPDPPPFTFAP